MKHFINNPVMTFHYGNAFEADGITAEPFATFTHTSIVDRALIDKVAKVVRDHVNRHDKDFCNVKITFEDWDC
jgi:ribosomal protein S15P/S13E